MAKTNKYLEASIKELDLDKKIYTILINNDIKLIKDLWVLNRTKLKEMGLKDRDIKDIIIQLQLVGLDLNKKIYN